MRRVRAAAASAANTEVMSSQMTERSRNLLAHSQFHFLLMEGGEGAGAAQCVYHQRMCQGFDPISPTDPRPDLTVSCESSSAAAAAPGLG